MNVKALLRSFAGGEITPELFGRMDLAKFQTGLAECRNFFVLPHGPVANRPGTEFVREVKDSTTLVRLVPFTFSTDQTVVLEFGHGYIRFHSAGGTILDGGEPYEVATPYLAAQLFALRFVQSADVLTIVHPSFAPRELRRMGATNWQLSQIQFAPQVAAPTGVAATPSAAGDDPVDQVYGVTAVAGESGQEESALSATATANVDLSTAGVDVTVSWTAVAGATRYNVFRRSNGLFGFIGQAAGTSFVDDNIAPDVSKTPPEPSNPFGSGDFPGAVSYFEQRRVFAGSTAKPQTVWMTRSGTESNLSRSIPTRDDDAITYRIASRQANTIRHVVPLADLILLTAGGVWRISTQNSDALTPSSISARQQSTTGASDVQPVVTDNAMLYAQARGGRVRELRYTWESQSYVANDASIMAPHLFDKHRVVDMAYAQAPYQILWAVQDNGRLLSMTYVPEHQVLAWSRHDTAGTFESVAVVTEGQEDAVYVVVRRTIGGQQRRYIERLHSRQFDTPAEAFFVDCGVRYAGAPATTFSGLAHLEGQTVSVLADGAVHPQRLVTGGQITLDQAASVVHAGLPITAQITTLPLAVEVQAAGQGNRKNVARVALRVQESGGIFIGPRADKLREAKIRTDEPYGSPPRLQSGIVEVVTDASWTRDAQLVVRQTDPLPLTIMSMTLDVEVGG